MNGPLRRAIAFLVGAALCACSTPSPQSLAEHDPWEKTNRDIFSFDVWVEHHIAEPVNDAYRFVLPAPATQSARTASCRRSSAQHHSSSIDRRNGPVEHLADGAGR